MTMKKIKGLNDFDYGDANTAEGDARRSKFVVIQEEGALYVGEKNAEGQKHGQGEQTWSNNSMYKGNWKNNMCHGEGQLTTNEGETYIGNW